MLKIKDKNNSVLYQKVFADFLKNVSVISQVCQFVYLTCYQLFFQLMETSCQSDIFVWNIETEESRCLDRLEVPRCYSFPVAIQKDKIMTTLNDGTILVWDAKSGKIIQIVDGDLNLSFVGEEWHHNLNLTESEKPILIAYEYGVIVWSAKGGIIQYEWTEGCLERVCQKSFVECGLEKFDHTYSNWGKPAAISEVRVVHNIMVS
jgi:hypothetical protein